MTFSQLSLLPTALVFLPSILVPQLGPRLPPTEAERSGLWDVYGLLDQRQSPASPVTTGKLCRDSSEGRQAHRGGTVSWQPLEDLGQVSPRGDTISVS